MSNIYLVAHIASDLFIKEVIWVGMSLFYVWGGMRILCCAQLTDGELIKS